MKGDRSEEIRQNEPFCAFQTFALPTDRPTNQPTDGHDLLQKCEDALNNIYSLKKMEEEKAEEEEWQKEMQLGREKIYIP